MAAGLIVRDVPRRAVNWRSASRAAAMAAARRHGRHRRHRHAQADAPAARPRRAERLHRSAGDAASTPTSTRSKRARKFPGLKGMDLAKEVCVREPYAWSEGQCDLDSSVRRAGGAEVPRRRLRLRRQAQHPAHARRARLRRDRRAGADAGRRSARDASPTACSCPTAPAIRSPATTRSPRPANSSAQDPDLRHLPRPPAPRPRGRARRR